MIQNIPALSIVIPAYNCMHTLPKVLKKLLEQNQIASNMEIIVIDDGSTDGTRDYLSSMSSNHHPTLKYLFQKNQGPALARNRGIEIATGKIILFLDADVIPSKELVPEHHYFHRQNPEDHIALRGNTIDLAPPELKNGIWTRSSVASFKTKSPNKKNLPWVEFLSGNISIKLKFILEKKLRFNEKLYVGEDVELGFKAQQHGLILNFSEKAVGYHHHPLTLHSYLKKGKLAGKSYATWYSSFPRIIVELEKLGVEHYCGFIGSHRPIFWKLKQYCKRLIANPATYPIFFSLANFKGVRNHKNLFWIVRQAYEINFRKAFNKELKGFKKHQNSL